MTTLSLLPQVASVSASSPGSAARSTSARTAVTGNVASSLIGYQPLSSGGNAFTATLLASAAARKATVYEAVSTDSVRQAFDVAALDRTVLGLRTVAAEEAVRQMAVSPVDWLLSNNGLTPQDSTQLSARAANFTQDLNRYLGTLAYQSSVTNNAAAGAAGALRQSVLSAVYSDYYLDDPVYDPADSSFGPQVSPTDIGFDVADGAITFDSSAFWAAYESAPVRTIGTYRALVGAIIDTVASFEPVFATK